MRLLVIMNIKLLLLAILYMFQAETLTMRGHVECDPEAKGIIDEELGEVSCVFKEDAGKVWSLIRSVTSESLFVDRRIQQRYLEVDAGTGANGSVDVYQIRSIIDGVIHDAHYWCDTCAIRSTSPGPCWCCYQPFEFREVPIGMAGPIDFE